MDVPVCEVRALLLSTTTHLPALRSLQLYAQVQHGVTMHVHPCKNRPCATSQAEQWGAASEQEGGREWKEVCIVPQSGQDPAPGAPASHPSRHLHSPGTSVLPHRDLIGGSTLSIIMIAASVPDAHPQSSLVSALLRPAAHTAECPASPVESWEGRHRLHKGLRLHLLAQNWENQPTAAHSHQCSQGAQHSPA